MKHIPLTKGYSTTVDDIDYEAVLAVGSWCYNASGYAVHYWRSPDKCRHTIYLHRFIYARILGHAIPPTLQIDHVSAREQGRAARLDNRRENLRLATRSQNQAAKANQKNSRSSHKGVTYRKGKYDVRLRYCHQRLYLGRYTDFNLAVSVYAYVHQILWNEFTSESDHVVCLPPATKEKIDLQIGNFLKA